MLYHTIAEAASQLGLSKATFLSLVRQGRILSERVGRAELIAEPTLRTYQAKRTKPIGLKLTDESKTT